MLFAKKHSSYCILLYQLLDRKLITYYRTFISFSCLCTSNNLEFSGNGFDQRASTKTGVLTNMDESSPGKHSLFTALSPLLKQKRKFYCYLTLTYA